MLLKTVRTSDLTITLSADDGDTNPEEQVKNITKEWMESNPSITQLLGYNNLSIDDALDRFKRDTLGRIKMIPNPFEKQPQVKEESFTDIYPPFKIIRTSLLNGLPGIPPDTVAIIQHTVEGRTESIFVSGDEEAYIISDTGVTVSVINGKKDVDDIILKSGKTTTVLSGNGSLSIKGDKVNIHSDVDGTLKYQSNKS